MDRYFLHLTRRFRLVQKYDNEVNFVECTGKVFVVMQKNKKYIVIEKQVGETPRMVLDRYRKENTWVGDIPLAYAGRLDPMAEGLLLVLVGDECKNQKKYHALDKEYEFEVLLGFSSDTGDILGMAESDAGMSRVSDARMKSIMRQLEGKQKFAYPVFSSKTVKGKPLFLWALEGRLGEINIPFADITIYNLDYKGMRTVAKKELWECMEKKIKSIPVVAEKSKALGTDFRRSDIQRRWKSVWDSFDDEYMFQIARFTCICSSGTYIRTLAEKIAEKADTMGLAYHIKRTGIGRYKQVWGRKGFWYKTFK